MERLFAGNAWVVASTPTVMILRTGSELINPFRVLEHVGIRERMHVADLGCGALGHYVFPAAQLVGPKGIIYAVDILKDVLEILERRAREDQYGNIKYIWSDIEVVGATHIPEAVDLTLLVNMLWHLGDPSSAIREMARLTKRGGHALVIDWKPSATGIGPAAEKRISLAEVKRLVTVDGLFEVEEEFEAGKAHYGLLFKRT
jgi:ubiquinone/menaquinone biosynthesis C-methylase UbiE